ncbi:MAG: DUF58 domain-containing protein [Anaerolineae bacterium]|nr:DUF58 domain-containing protein [Anaerolineae bacterium]
MPERRLTLYLILIGAVLLGIITGEPLFFTLAYFALGTLILAVLWAWTGLAGLRFERRALSQRGQVGQSYEETLAVHNRSILPRLWLEVRDESTLPGHIASRVVFHIPRRGAQTWTVRTNCTRRGRYRLGPVTLVSGDPFGFFEQRRAVAETGEVLVYPATFPIHGFDPAVGILPGGESVSLRTHAITPNAAGVRDYVTGDSLRQIHWLSSARRARLTVKEFEMDPLADFWIVLDNHAEAHVPGSSHHPLGSTEEYGVSIAASLAEHFLQKQRAVGLVTYAPNRAWIMADRGPRQIRKILELLAVTEATGQMSLGNLLRLEGEKFARTTTLLIVTPSLDPAWLASVRWLKLRRVKVAVVHIDPETFGGAFGASNIYRAAGIEGVPVYPVRRGDSLSAALSRRGNGW